MSHGVHGIRKSFGESVVLDDVSLEIRPGTVHVLAGENGAGKSTLIKILGGVHPPDSGTMTIDGRSFAPRTPHEARRAGVALVHQELSLVESMTVAENLALPRRRSGLRRRREDRDRAAAALAAVGLAIDPECAVESLSLAERQLVEIARATEGDVRLLILDEPTSALGHDEAERLFDVVQRQKERGVAMIYISHKMEEIARLVDDLTILRDGRVVGRMHRSDFDARDLVRMMVGRDVDGEVVLGAAPQDGGLIVRGLDIHATAIHDRRSLRPQPTIDLDVRFGEIVGIAGLEGSGKNDLLAMLAGARGAVSAERVELDGRSLDYDSPRSARRAGIAYVPGDRRREGLIHCMSVADNATLSADALSTPLKIRRTSVARRVAEAIASSTDLRAASFDHEVATLSGGNQQKVLLGRSIAVSPPRVWLLDEPTRGIDIGAKHEIHAFIRTMAARGMAVMLVTSELPELLSLCERILVLHRGRMVATFGRADATAEAVTAAALGDGEQASRSMSA